jgi:uncharacterized protein YqjF (DUF2071 family)
MSKPLFLKALWKNLVMINYEVAPEILKPYLPPGTVLDLWQDKCLVSMVGFMFLETQVLGVKWPFHVNFEEVNLRFYVRHFDGKEWKRGAVFISEIVPKYAIVLFANGLYKEHYCAMPMRHSIVPTNDNYTEFLYEWKLNGNWNKLEATVSDQLQPIALGSPEEFIFEHYWGYNGLSATKTMEYQVEHISWQTGKVKNFVFDVDVEVLYGKPFVNYLQATPYSVFFADGSAIGVRMGQKITTG